MKVAKWSIHCTLCTCNSTVEHGFLLLQAMMLLTSIRNLISAHVTVKLSNVCHPSLDTFNTDVVTYSGDYKLASIVRVWLISSSIYFHLCRSQLRSNHIELNFRCITVTLIFAANRHAVIHAPIGNQVSLDSTARAYTILGWVSSCSI